MCKSSKDKPWPDNGGHLLTLRSLTPADYPLLLRWLAEPHIKEWWDDGDDTLEKVAKHYGNQSATRENFLLLYQDEAEGTTPRPIGYMQYEIDACDVVSIDQFIGEEALLGQGIGAQAIRLLIDLVLSRHQPVTFTVDPSPANARAIRCYEKVGFRYTETIRTSQDEDAYMMRLDLLQLF